MPEVIKLNRYPVKSMGGEPLTLAQISHTGVVGDRQYSFVQTDSKSSFPWLTARNLPCMVLYAPRYELGSDVKSPVTVQTPEGQQYPVASDELKAELETKSGRKIHLLRLGRGTYDAMPISVISLETIRRFSEAVGVDLDVRRFRPNVVIDQGLNTQDFDELVVGSVLRFGNRPDSAEVYVSLRDPRCKIINIDPDTAQTDKRVLKVMEGQFENLLGVYGTVKKPGTIEVGDKLEIIRI